MREHGIIFALVLMISGCAEMQSVNPFRPSSTALETAGKLASPSTSRAERDGLIADVKARYDKDQSAENLLALIVVYAIPGQEQSSNQKAMALLNKLDMDKLSPHSRQLADWLSSDVTYRESLERNNAQLGDQLAITKRALARAREKIDILTRIEQTIGPSPELEKGQRGKQK